MTQTFQWDSTDLLIPMKDFLNLYKLTWNEMVAEAGSGRLKVSWRSQKKLPSRPHPRDIKHFCVSEKSAKRWLTLELVGPIAEKVAASNGTQAIIDWRKDYFKQIKWHLEENAATLPNGERIENIQVNRADLERLLAKMKS